MYYAWYGEGYQKRCIRYNDNGTWLVVGALNCTNVAPPTPGGRPGGASTGRLTVNTTRDDLRLKSGSNNVFTGSNTDIGKRALLLIVAALIIGICWK